MTTVRPRYLPALSRCGTIRSLILGDGTTATIRIAQTSDKDALKEFFRRFRPNPNAIVSLPLHARRFPSEHHIFPFASQINGVLCPLVASTGVEN